MSDNQLMILPNQNGDCSLVRNGLEIKPGLTFEQWENIGVMLDVLGKSLQFAIGDWINYGERKYGEMYAQAVNLTTYSEHSLINIASVARNVPMSLRKDDLTYSHHVAVAYVADRETQAALLDEAQECRLSVRQLQTNVRTLKIANGNPTDNTAAGQEICPNCGWKLEG